MVSTDTYLSFSYHSGQPLPIPWKKFRDFPGGPVVKTLSFQCSECESNPWLGNEDQNLKKKKRKKFSLQFCLGFGLALPFACGLLLGRDNLFSSARLQRLLAMVKERLTDIPVLRDTTALSITCLRSSRGRWSARMALVFWPTLPKRPLLNYILMLCPSLLNQGWM